MDIKMQSDGGSDLVNRLGRKILSNNFSANLSTNGLDIDSKCSNTFKIPQTTSVLMTSTPKNRDRKFSMMTDSMQVTSEDMGYNTMGSSCYVFKTPISRNYSGNITALSTATSSDSAPVSSQNTVNTPCDKLGTEVLHGESGYVSVEGRLPSYYHSTPYTVESSNRCLLDSADRSISIFEKPVRLNLSDISAGQEESLHEISHLRQFMTPDVDKKRTEKSSQIKNYFSFDESLGLIGRNVYDSDFELISHLLTRHDKKITSKILGFLHDADVSRLFMVSKNLRNIMESNEEAILRRERYKKFRLDNKENPRAMYRHLRTHARTGPRKPLGHTQAVASIERRKREPSLNDSSEEMFRRDGMCIHCSSCWKTASVIGMVATCTSLDCGYQRCMLCGRQAHDNQPCMRRRTFSSTSHSVGSRESKNNLKRIARRC